MATTFQNIIDRAKSRVDMTRSQFVDDGDWQNFVMDAYAKLHNLMVHGYVEYFTKLSDPFTIDGQGQVDVPADFQRLHYVDVQDGTGDGEWCSIFPKGMSERNGYRRSLGVYLRVWRRIGFRLIDRKVWFFPDNVAAGRKTRFWYTPLPARDQALSSSIPIDMEQWSEYLVLECAIMAAIKEETDDSAFVRERMIMTAKIEDEAQRRSVQEADETVDVEGDYYPGGGRMF